MSNKLKKKKTGSDIDLAKHYAFILDRSETGIKTLAELKDKSCPFQDRFTSGAFQIWEELHDFGYIVVWGSLGYSGGLTIPAKDLDTLLNEALPKTIERTLEKGGLCAFTIAVDPAVAPQVQACIETLQPTFGPVSATTH